jgi:spermidine synthase
MTRRALPEAGSFPVRIGEDGGREALLVDGVVQSISPHDGEERGGYWAAMLPPNRPRSALILGFGGGTIAYLLVSRWGETVEIVGVDDDVAVLETARAVGWVPPNVLLEVTDAFDYLRHCRRRFDYVAVDLYRADHFVGRSLTRPVLKRLAALLAPGGWLAVNLFINRLQRQRVERLSQIFTIRRQVPVGGNVIIHAQH